VKRYNHRGLIHSLRHTIKKSRARRSWLNGHLLAMLNIATPKPLAFIEEYRGLLLWKSYLVTEYVDGRRLSVLLRDNSITEDKRSEITQQINRLLDKLEKYHIIHGDLKHTNILISENNPVLTDLDAMKTHKWDWTYKARQTKDMTRFRKT
jgi:serine/threonine protein kinase